MEITFDKKCQLFGKDSLTFRVKVKSEGAGTSEWMSLFLTEKYRAVHNGVESIGWMHGTECGQNQCWIIVVIKPYSCCPVSEYLFPGLISAIHEAERFYQIYKIEKAKVLEELEALEKSWLK